ncbi:hypothetical protein [Marmoricola sp. RAF53]
MKKIVVRVGFIMGMLAAAAGLGATGHGTHDVAQATKQLCC